MLTVVVDVAYTDHLTGHMERNKTERAELNDVICQINGLNKLHRAVHLFSRSVSKWNTY